METGGEMKLNRCLIALALLVLFGSQPSFSQIRDIDEPHFIHTQTTAFKLSFDDKSWVCVDFNDSLQIDWFLYLNDVNFHNKIISAWVRSYYYQKKEIVMDYFSINMETKMINLGNEIQYNTKNGEVIRSINANDSSGTNTYLDLWVNLYFMYLTGKG